MLTCEVLTQHCGRLLEEIFDHFPSREHRNQIAPSSQAGNQVHINNTTHGSHDQHHSTASLTHLNPA